MNAPKAFQDPSWDPRKRLVFWRHGRTAWNVQGRYQGSSDIPLDEVGHHQAKAASKQLSLMQPGYLFSSPLQRATSTAQYLAEETGLSVAVDERITETNAGSWEGLTFPEIMKQDPEVAAQWAGGDHAIKAGGGESRFEVASRVRAFLDEVIEKINPGETAVLVTHGGASRAGLASILGLPPEVWGSLAGLSNCRWSVVSEQGHSIWDAPGWRLAEHNAGSLPPPVLVQEG